MNPARLAPTAGAKVEVNVLLVRGFRFRNGFASTVKRCARRRVKNRKSKRWKRRIVDSERDSRRFGDFHNDVLGFLFQLENFAISSQ
jgi:hypothetical protein